jgi:predicted enzyme related to lactoylglutathione lyase
MSQLFQIDYFELASSNGPRSRDFFEEAFGWRFKEHGADYNEFEDAGMAGGMQSAPAEATAAPLIVVRTDDLENAERVVVTAGGAITRPAFDYPGGRRFHFREPGGNELAIYVVKD